MEMKRLTYGKFLDTAILWSDFTGGDCNCTVVCCVKFCENDAILELDSCDMDLCMAVAKGRLLLNGYRHGDFGTSFWNPRLSNAACSLTVGN